MEPRTDKNFILPKSLHERSSLKAGVGIVYAALLFFGSWALLGALWSTKFALSIKIIAALPILIVAGYGMLLMGFMGHDGTHFTLSDNKVTSAKMGIFITAPIFPYMLMGFTISHWNHHKFTNGLEDPDAVLFSRFKTLFGRMFLARPFSFWEYGSNTVRLALGIALPFKYQFPLEPAVVQRLARINVAATFFVGVIYFAVALYSPVYFAALTAIYLFGTAISGLSPYVEHTGTGLGRGRDTRTAIGRWWDALILGNNYHIEHHLYPTIPFYHLKKAHHHLVAQGFYSQADRYVSGGAWDTYRYAFGKYPYPKFTKNPDAGN